MYEKIAVLYSFEQKCFHVETLKDYCAANVNASIKKFKIQFRLISIADNDQQASKIIELFRKKFNW